MLLTANDHTSIGIMSRLHYYCSQQFFAWLDVTLPAVTVKARQDIYKAGIYLAAVTIVYYLPQ